MANHREKRGERRERERVETMREREITGDGGGEREARDSRRVS